MKTFPVIVLFVVNTQINAITTFMMNPKQLLKIFSLVFIPKLSLLYDLWALNFIQCFIIILDSLVFLCCSWASAFEIIFKGLYSVKEHKSIYFNVHIRRPFENTIHILGKHSIENMMKRPHLKRLHLSHICNQTLFCFSSSG